MKQNRRVNNAIKRESIRDKKSDVRLNRVRVNKIIKEEDNIYIIWRNQNYKY